jgi:hypothetical protein
MGSGADQPGGVLDIAAAQQQFRRMDRRGVVVGHQLDGAPGMCRCAGEIADRGQRAAQMSMTFRPIGRPREQLFIGRCRVLMAAAIAEQPGAEIGGAAIVRGQGKGAAAAFERLVAAPAMEQRLGGTAIQYSGSRAASVATSQELKADIKVPGAERRRECIGINQEWGDFPIGIQLAEVPR